MKYGLCPDCFEHEEAEREAEWQRYLEQCRKEDERLQEEEEAAADEAADLWAQEQTAFEPEAGLRHIRVGA